MHQLQIMSLVKCWVCPAPGFAALRSAIIRVRQAKENYCDCALVVPDERLSRESRKLTVMMRRALVNYSRGLQSLEIFSALCEESVFVQLGMYSAPSPAFRILGAFPQFKIVDFYG